MYSQVLDGVNSLVKTGWPVGKEQVRMGRQGKLWRVGKSEKVGFKARKKLVAGESALKGWEEVKLMALVYCVCQEQRILDLLVESSISG